ncbi:hypothetical protein, partial [Pseudomonas sp. FW305-122]|uniref:hypothetical protein n=1 Tax=Pseudomonas sp. FW305-122 TaxID=2070561 RepID=UPI001C43A270
NRPYPSLFRGPAEAADGAGLPGKRTLRPFSIKKTFIMSGQLPYFASHFSLGRTGVYPIQTREARQSAVEIAGG